MKRMAALVLVATIALVMSASAESTPSGLDNVLKAMRVAIVAPTEWDGLWTTTDTVYTCLGAFQSTSSGIDTICGGKEYSASAPGTAITFTCNGTADATAIDVTCTASDTVFADCDANYTTTTHSTRTGDTYFAVSVVNVTYTGTGIGCSLLQPLCIQVNSHGSRTGPAPALFCSTPAKRSTWGLLKIRYGG